MHVRRNARVVVLVELDDGEIRAIDGNGNVEIESFREPDQYWEIGYNSSFANPLQTRITVDIVGKWTMYTGTYPQQKETGQLEERKEIE